MSSKSRSRAKQHAKPAARPAAPTLHVKDALLFAIVFGLGVVLFGIISVSLGQDNNWDLRNYHYYNPYAFLNNRLGFDIAPAQMQTYFNPVTDLLFYFLVNHVRPSWVGFIMGGLHGLSLGLVFMIAYLIFSGFKQWPRAGLSLLCALIGLYGPIFIGELGASQNDTIMSLFILGAVLLLLRHINRPNTTEGWKALIAPAAAGALIGFAAGLKDTSAIYAVGMAVAILFIEPTWKIRIRTLVVWGGGALVAFLIIRGHWLLTLNGHFGNPMFPYFNNIFHSPWTEQVSNADMRYMPANFVEALFRPFMYVVKNQFTLFSNDFRDARYAVLYVLLLALIVAWYIRRRKNRADKSHASDTLLDRSGFFLVIFFAVTYIVWQIQFSIIRYTSGLEALGPLLIVILIFALVRIRWLQGVLIAAAFLFIAVDMQALNHNRLERLPWTGKFWDVQTPRLEDPDHTIILIAGSRPWGYLMPFFPKGVRFVRVESNFTNPRSATRMQEEIRNVLGAHQGPMFLLTRPQYLQANNEVLNAYRLAAGQNAMPVYSKHEPNGLVLCPVSRKSS
ncbi:DUF2029 domain-containing protein [candidate division KSB1 bacterium]|nr:MAG: DUF2029 domain-containing protein [candidate division KSB1 bacterium]